MAKISTHKPNKIRIGATVILVVLYTWFLSNTLGIGAVVAYVVALLAIKFFIEYLQKHGFKIFGWYRIVAGIIVLILLQQNIIK